MKLGSNINSFLSLAIAIGALQTLLSCAEQSAPPTQPTLYEQELNALPEDFTKALKSESLSDQEAFFAKPQPERNAILAEWERRKELTAPFTQSEKELISILSQDDSNAFFAMAPDKKNQLEQFLADAENRYSDMLNYCLVATHRRFGPPLEIRIDEATKKRFTPSEQAIIKSLTASEVKDFFAEPIGDQQKFLADAVDRKTDQLLECVSRPSRHSEEGAKEHSDDDSPPM